MATFDLATAATIALVIALVIARRLGSRGVLIEKLSLAIFLTGMPVVYIARWIETSGAGTGATSLRIEFAGLLIYSALAILGLWRSPWFLVIGIAAHGLLWDAWHYLDHSTYIPGWYSLGCLAVDVALSLYVATRVPAWRAR